LSILARAEKETELAEGDCLVYVGAEITPNGFFVEGKLQSAGKLEADADFN
jgi:hypothetical protein